MTKDVKEFANSVYRVPPSWRERRFVMGLSAYHGSNAALVVESMFGKSYGIGANTQFASVSAV